jgi:hypothetical protein
MESHFPIQPIRGNSLRMREVYSLWVHVDVLAVLKAAIYGLLSLILILG